MAGIACALALTLKDWRLQLTIVVRFVFQNDLTIWDLGGPAPVLQAEIDVEVAAGRFAATGTAVVPGCGSAYDVLALAHRGLSRVVGVDFAPEAITKATGVCGSDARIALVCGDFFAAHADLPDSSFDFIFDYTVSVPCCILFLLV